MTISKDKTYKTRNGMPVRIYATDGGGLYPVHGAYNLKEDVWVSECWTSSGILMMSTRDRLDLVEVTSKRQSKSKKPIKKAVKR
jgi:hypothetical protein